MRNKEKWTAGKFVYRRGRLAASRDAGKVGVGSRLIGDIVASLYEESIPRYVKGKLADLGCGRVPLYEVYRDHVTDNVCVDWSGSLHGNEHLDLECDLCEPLPFPDGEFDSIILSDVLEHLPRPEAFWGELSRIVAPGGVVLCNVPFCYGLHEVPHDYYRYSEHALRRFAETSGFEVLSLKAIGGSPEVFADMLAKHLQVVPVVGKPMAILVQSLAAAFVRMPVGRRLSEKTSRAYPLGYFIVLRREDERAPARH